MIKYYRQKKGYTQEQVARLLNVSLSYYQKIERYKHYPNVLIALKLAKILDANPYDLWTIP